MYERMHTTRTYLCVYYLAKKEIEKEKKRELLMNFKIMYRKVFWK